MRRRAKQEKRQQRRQVPQEKKPEAGVRVRSRAAAHSSAPKAAEEPEYKRVYKPRVRLGALNSVLCSRNFMAGAIATMILIFTEPHVSIPGRLLRTSKGNLGIKGCEGSVKDSLGVCSLLGSRMRKSYTTKASHTTHQVAITRLGVWPHVQAKQSAAEAAG